VPLALGIHLHLLPGLLRLQLAQFNGQLLLSLTRAKEARVIPRERLLSQKKGKEMRKRSKRSRSAKNKKEEDAYLKLLSKRSRSY
jgi:hypothetical protein